MDKNFITQQGWKTLEIVKKWDLEKYYNPIGGEIVINDKEMTNDLKIKMINYLDDFRKSEKEYCLNNNITFTSSNYDIVIEEDGDEKYWIIGERPF